jgi:hypothetical protein
MKRATIIKVCNALFKGIDSPWHVFGQEQCVVLKRKSKGGRIVNYKVKGTDEDLFLKPLERLFDMEDSIFSRENTIIVDDSPTKQVTNNPENVIPFDMWFYQGYGAMDGILIDHLLPYIWHLHKARPTKLYSFWRDDAMGHFHLFDESDLTEFIELN